MKRGVDSRAPGSVHLTRLEESPSQKLHPLDAGEVKRAIRASSGRLEAAFDEAVENHIAGGLLKPLLKPAKAMTDVIEALLSF